MRDLLIGVGLTGVGFYCGLRGWDEATSAKLPGVALALFGFAGLILLSVAWLRMEMNDLRRACRMMQSEIRCLLSRPRVLVSGGQPERLQRPAVATGPAPHSRARKIEQLGQRAESLLGDVHPFAADAVCNVQDAWALAQIGSAS